MLNRVTLVGRLTKDVEIRKTENMKSVANFSLAVAKPFKNNNGNYDTYFFQVQAWGSPAEYLASYAKQGDIIGIDGRLDSYSYDDRISGAKRYITQVIAQNVKIISSKVANRGENNQNDEIVSYEETMAETGLNEEIQDSDLPF